MITRSSGILLPISALPSPHGIGTLGAAAYGFVDFLHRAGQRYWQLLPVGPTGCGDSPYQSFSAHAGNPYFVDLDLLVEDGLLTAEELSTAAFGDDPGDIDYGKLYENRLPLLEKAACRGFDRDRAAVAVFVAENRRWLPDYALFMAAKRQFGMRAWTDWDDEDLRLRRPEALEKYTALLAADIQVFTYLQFLFFRQFSALRAYAAERDVHFIGDLPIYVAADSADVWAEPAQFQLDAGGLPVAVAGVPPDSFCPDGQLWGNPLYNWEQLRADGYGWWIRRIESAARLFDVLRIDHFRGLESYWSVPYGAKTAADGHWVQGPGMDLVGVLTAWFSDLQFIAEDLGILTPAVRKLLADSGLPGMRVLEFAFDGGDAAAYLPHNYHQNCVCYIGTHDNAPVAAWQQDAAPALVDAARAYFAIGENEPLHLGLLRGGMASVATLFVAQMQDVLGLTARTNTPGTRDGNWRWRLLPGALTDSHAAGLRELTTRYGR
ncbi:MAG: 4-alpha-glucanotransferase [Oscillospiraceae bacterium]